jgi:hypothetical protein
MSTLPELFARACGLACEGPHRCWYCGAPCGDQFPVAAYVRDTFTDADRVARPGSPYVCVGCTLCLREDCDVPLCTGQTRRVTKAAMRMHSWLVTADRVMAATKATACDECRDGRRTCPHEDRQHLAWQRRTCLSPPAPPWALSIAVSGQKQVLYRGIVNESVDQHVVTLEGERVDYTSAQLQAALADATRIASLCGKPALADPPTWWHRIKLHEHHGDEGVRLADWWDASRGDPLFHLAVFLCPSRREQEDKDEGKDTDTE